METLFLRTGRCERWHFKQWCFKAHCSKAREVANTRYRQPAQGRGTTRFFFAVAAPGATTTVTTKSYDYEYDYYDDSTKYYCHY